MHQTLSIIVVRRNGLHAHSTQESVAAGELVETVRRFMDLFAEHSVGQRAEMQPQLFVVVYDAYGAVTIDLDYVALGMRRLAEMQEVAASGTKH